MVGIRWGFVVVLLLALISLTVAPGSGSAAAPGLAADAAAQGASAPATELPATLSREGVRDLIARLSDDEVRKLLIGQLDKVAAAAEAARTPAGPTLDTLLVEAQWRLQTAIDAIPGVLGFGSIIAGKFAADGGVSFGTVLGVLIIFGAGIAGEGLFRRVFPRFEAEPAVGRQPRTTEKIALLGMRLVRDLLALTVFGLATTAMFFVLWPGNEAIRAATASLFWIIIIVRGVAALSRFALAPGELAAMRLPDIPDAAARGIHIRLLFVTGAIAVAYYVSDFVERVAGNDPGALLLLDAGLVAIVLGVLIAIVWRDRRAFREALLARDDEDSEPPGRLRLFVARNWHILVTAFLILVGLLHLGRRLLTGQSDPQPILVSLIALAALPAIDVLICSALKGLLKVRASMDALDAAQSREAAARAAVEAGPGLPEDAEPDLLATRRAELADALSAAVADRRAALRTLQTRRDYRHVLLRSLRLVVGVLFVVILAKVWDVNLESVAARGVGETLAGSAFDIIAVLLIASAAWGIVNAAIRNALPPEREEDGGESEVGGQGGTRLQTLVPLFGRFLLVVIVVMVALIILSELGVDIGPLIAGAGVVGIAIGFGAQTLVRDILSGVFFLVDDAFRVGEYIDVGSVRGMVEHISIRSFRLRHHLGPVHTIPFGEIQHLTNFSRDWAIMKLELRVPFETDLEKVRKIVKKVGQELLAHPEFGKSFLQPVKSQGVNRMDDDAFIVRVKFMSRPGEQFVLRREVYRRIQESFAQNGIHFAPRRVIVDTGGAPLTPLAAAAAAAAAIDTDKTGEGPDGHGGAMDL